MGRSNKKKQAWKKKLDDAQASGFPIGLGLLKFPVPPPKFFFSLFSVYMFVDLDNIIRDLPLPTTTTGDFSFRPIITELENHLKKINNDDNYTVEDTYVVGNLHTLRTRYSRYKQKISWHSAQWFDVYPRDKPCDFYEDCGTMIDTAVEKLRAPEPFEKVTDVGDDMLLTKIYQVALKNKKCTILLVTGDRDFKKPVKTLIDLGHKVYLATPVTSGTSKKLKNLVTKRQDEGEKMIFSFGIATGGGRT